MTTMTTTTTTMLQASTVKAMQMNRANISSVDLINNRRFSTIEFTITYDDNDNNDNNNMLQSNFEIWLLGICNAQ